MATQERDKATGRGPPEDVERVDEELFGCISDGVERRR